MLAIRLCEVVLLLHCRALNTYCSGVGGHGWRQWLFYTDLGLPIPNSGDSIVPTLDIRSVTSEVLADSAFESKYWDPGLVVSHLVSDDGFEHHLWDPSLPASSKLIEVTRCCAYLSPANFRDFPMVWSKQQKCGGYVGRDIDWYILDSAQLPNDIWGIRGCKLWLFLTEAIDVGVQALFRSHLQFVDSIIASVQVASRATDQSEYMCIDNLQSVDSLCC
jgi:hypothetical protein